MQQSKTKKEAKQLTETVDRTTVEFESKQMKLCRRPLNKERLQQLKDRYGENFERIKPSARVKSAYFARDLAEVPISVIW